MPVAVSELDLAATRAFLKANRLTRLRCRSRAQAREGVSTPNSSLQSPARRRLSPSSPAVLAPRDRRARLGSDRTYELLY